MTSEIRPPRMTMLRVVDEIDEVPPRMTMFRTIVDGRDRDREHEHEQVARGSSPDLKVER